MKSYENLANEAALRATEKYAESTTADIGVEYTSVLAEVNRLDIDDSERVD